MKIRKLFVVSLLSLFLLTTGCGLQKLTKLQTPSSTPSWSVDMRAPLIKGTLPIGEEVQWLLNEELPADVVVEPHPDTGVFTYYYTQVLDHVGVKPEDLQLQTQDLTIPPVSWGGDPTGSGGPVDGGPISLGVFNFLTDGAYSVPYSNTTDSIIPPQTVSFDQSNGTPGISIPNLEFTSMTFTNAENNKIDVILETNEPIDHLEITLYQEGNATPLASASWTNVTGNLNAEQTAFTEMVTDTQALSLQGTEVVGGGKNLYCVVTLTAHTTDAIINLTLNPSSSMEIGEVLGGDPTQYGFDTTGLTDISIESIQPFAALPVESLVFETGTITIAEEKIFAGDNFLFDIDLVMTDGNGSTLNWLETNPDGGWIIDLAGRAITKDITISATVNANVVDYDVWDHIEQKVVPYSYSLGVDVSNIGVRSVTVSSLELTEFIEDPNPETPDVWDITLAESATEKLPLDFPEGLNVGLSKFYLDLELNNDTDLQGTISLTVNSYENETDTVPSDSARLDLTLTKRTLFKLSDQPGYDQFIDKFIAILNSQPNYIDVVPGGSIEVTESITVNNTDGFSGKLDVALPIELTLFEGGATIEGIMDEHVDLASSERDMIGQMADFIEEASLKIDYTNRCTLGFGGTITFTAPGYPDQVIDFDILPAHYEQTSGRAQFTVTQTLAKLLAEPTGFDMKVDLRLPNDTGEEHLLSVRSQDQLDFNIYMDGVVNVHVPSDM